MRWLIKPFQLLYCIYALLLFVALMLIVFPFAILSSFFGRINGGNMLYRLCMVWADLWFPLVGIFHKNIYEQPLRKGASYVFVTNHTSYLDAAIIPKAVRQPVRPLGKVEMAKVPIFGYIYKNAIVTVDRSSAENRSKSVRILRSVLSKGVSILFFPEGTFNESGKPLKSFYDGAFRIAIETKTPIKPVLYVDAYERLHPHNIFSLTPGKNRVVFLPEIPTENLTNKDIAALKQQVYDLMDTKLREYGASWIV
ncbi:lysophospholipid acyltransferase family protein [Flavisolibacter tropicus]|uniref:Acyl-phosphate glycerol 3-phosphate acyltransferase n=1 Tax=Flavisolibacter tropicus TaxID=1492898 RepID=A0A172U1B8_9BACT|nr:lysophospholipid acyltransferase family protein [Flavisolibacter tropicus]ANE53120.1 acyl-phosphate glycerol 3-phosphate acyltransferase [Flavisolibacter tropicus]